MNLVDWNVVTKEALVIFDLDLNLTHLNTGIAIRDKRFEDCTLFFRKRPLYLIGIKTRFEGKIAELTHCTRKTL